jgi:hypothetical protein
MDYYLLGKLPEVEPPKDANPRDANIAKPNAATAPIKPAETVPEEEHYD